MTDDRNVDRVEGVEYTPEAVESVRQLLVDIRDTALARGWFHDAAGLSHAIVYLSHYAEALRSVTAGFDYLEPPS